MRQLTGVLVIGACCFALWLGGFYSHHSAPSPALPVTTVQPHPRASHKAHHLPHVPHMRIHPARLFGGWGNGNGSGQ